MARWGEYRKYFGALSRQWLGEGAAMLLAAISQLRDRHAARRPDDAEILWDDGEPQDEAAPR